MDRDTFFKIFLIYITPLREFCIGMLHVDGNHIRDRGIRQIPHNNQHHQEPFSSLSPFINFECNDYKEKFYWILKKIQ